MYYSYVEIKYVAMSFSPARTDLALKLFTAQLVNMFHKYYGMGINGDNCSKNAVRTFTNF
jgi:hypothetical protein